MKTAMPIINRILSFTYLSTEGLNSFLCTLLLYMQPWENHLSDCIPLLQFFFFFSHSLSSFHRLFLLAFPCWPAGSCSFRFSSFVWARKSLHKNNNNKKKNTAQPSSEPWHPDLNIYIYKKSTTLLRQFLFPSNVWTPHKIPQKLTVKQKQKRTNKQNKKKANNFNIHYTISSHHYFILLWENFIQNHCLCSLLCMKSWVSWGVCIRSRDILSSIYWANISASKLSLQYRSMRLEIIKITLNFFKRRCERSPMLAIVVGKYLRYFIFYFIRLLK